MATIIHQMHVQQRERSRLLAKVCVAGITVQNRTQGGRDRCSAGPCFEAVKVGHRVYSKKSILRAKKIAGKTVIIQKLPLITRDLRYLWKTSNTQTICRWGRRHACIIFRVFIKHFESYFRTNSKFFRQKSFNLIRKSIFIRKKPISHQELGSI